MAGPSSSGPPALAALLLLACAARTSIATPNPTCAAAGEVCAASTPPPPPPSGPCLSDGARWASDPRTECCCGYGFGQYCCCVPSGSPVQQQDIECCTRFAVNNGTAQVCGGYPDPPGFASVVLGPNEVLPNKFDVNITLTSPANLGAMATSIVRYRWEIVAVPSNETFAFEATSPFPDPLLHTFTLDCETIDFYVTATDWNNLLLSSGPAYYGGTSPADATVLTGYACGCFPADATVRTADGRDLPMARLRLGDRVLAVGWDGRLVNREVYGFGRRSARAAGLYRSVAVLGAGVGAAPRTLRLTADHLMAAAPPDPAGACAALAAARGGAAEGGAARAWRAAADHLSWDDHEMAPPGELAAGRVAWVAGAAGGVEPACVLDVAWRHEVGAYTPLVRARGIVVDGVVASHHSIWDTLLGWELLPRALQRRAPAAMEAALWPLWAGYKLAGPGLAWRLYSLPAFEDWRAFYLYVGNALVWGHAAAAAAAAVALRGAARRARKAA